jgi:O-antigen/teichoic acid export membrane protein
VSPSPPPDPAGGGSAGPAASAPASTTAQGSLLLRLWRRLTERRLLNTAVYFGAAVLSKAVSILLLPIYTRRLDRAEYAIYGLCQTLYWIGPPLATLALSSALVRFYFDERDPERRRQRTGAIALGILIGALGGGLLFEAILQVWPGFSLMHVEARYLRIVGWTCAAIAIAEIPTAYFRASEQAGRFVAVNFTSFGVTAGVTVYLMVVANLGLTGLLLGMLAGQAAGALVGMVFVLAVLRPRFDAAILREAAIFSTPFIPHLIGNAVMTGVDRWALEYRGLQQELGLYTLAVQLCVPITMATAAWNDASTPGFLAAWRDGGPEGARRATPRMTLGFVACGGAVLLMIVAGFPLLRHFVGVRFQAAFPLVPWVGLALLTGTLFSAGVNVLSLTKGTYLIPILTGASVLVTAGCNLALIPVLGVYGAILGTGLGLSFRSGAMMLAGLRALGRDVRAGAMATSTPSR